MACSLHKNLSILQRTIQKVEIHLRQHSNSKENTMCVIVWTNECEILGSITDPVMSDVINNGDHVFSF